MIDTEKVLQDLKETDISSHSLEKEIGISKTILSQLRSGKKSIENLNVSTFFKIADYFKKNP